MKTRLSYLPIFTIIWFYALLIPQYVFLYGWEGKGSRTAVYTLSTSAIHEVPPTTSVFSAFINITSVLFFLIKFIWLTAMDQQYSTKAISAPFHYIFLAFAIAASITMWIFGTFYSTAYGSLHGDCAGIYFALDIACFVYITVIDQKYGIKSKAAFVHRLAVFAALVASGIGYVAVWIMAAVTHTRKNEILRNNFFSAVEIIWIVLGSSMYLSMVPYFETLSVDFHPHRGEEDVEEKKASVPSSVEGTLSVDVPQEEMSQ